MRKAALVLAAVAALAVAAPASARPICDPGWQFTHVRNIGRGFTVYDRQRDENHTNHRIHVTLTAKRGGSYTRRASVHLEASAQAKIWKIVMAKVRATFDAQVAVRLTAQIGNSVSSFVRAHHALIGRYGIFHRAVVGHVYYLTSVCTVTRSHPNATFRMPDEVGWRVFERRL